MDREEAIEVLKKNYPDICYTMLREAVDMAIEALKTQDVVEELTQDLADRLNDAYAAGYSAAKREIALSGEYERAYQRGKADATKWIPCSERLPEERGLYFVTEQNFGRREEADLHEVVSHSSYYYGDDKWSDRFYFYDVSNITAWKLLPEPYKAESEDKE